MRFYFHCHEISPHGTCCSSCHSEWYHEVGVPTEHEIGIKTIIYACCAFRDIGNKDRKILAGYIRQARKHRKKEKELLTS